jgi:molybdenum cofactor biosynthesis enzyme MoaA
MNNVKSIGFALDPINIPSFLLDWELTKLCNLDCSYCGVGDEFIQLIKRHVPVDVF